MLTWVKGLLSAGTAFFLLWILWKMKDAFPGSFESVLIAAVVGTALIIVIAFSGDNNRSGQPVQGGSYE